MPKRFHKSSTGKRIARLEKHEIGEHGASFYDSMSSRNAQESKDGSMIREDFTAMANLPQEVMIKAYPTAPGAMYPHLNDTFTGVDSQNAHDASKMKREKNPSKY